jgi:hypothetical protein
MGNIGTVIIVAISFPVSFFVARGCLRGVIRLVTGGGPGGEQRHVRS